MDKATKDSLSVFGLPDTENIEKKGFFLKKVRKNSLQADIISGFRLTEAYREAFLQNTKQVGFGTPGAVEAIKVIHRFSDEKEPFEPDPNLMADVIYSRHVLNFQYGDYFLFGFAEKSISQRMTFLSAAEERRLLQTLCGSVLPYTKIPKPEKIKDGVSVFLTAATVLTAQGIQILCPYLTVTQKKRTYYLALSQDDGTACGKWVNMTGKSVKAPEIPAFNWTDISEKLYSFAEPLAEIPFMIWKLAITAEGVPKLTDWGSKLLLRMWQCSAAKGIRIELMQLLTEAGLLPDPDLVCTADLNQDDGWAFYLPAVPENSLEEQIINRQRLTESYREAFGNELLHTNAQMREVREARAAIEHYTSVPRRSEYYRELLCDLLYSRFILGFQYKEYFLYQFMHKSIVQRLEYIPASAMPQYYGIINRNNQSNLLISEPFEAWKGLRSICHRDSAYIRGEEDRDLFLDFCALHPHFIMRKARGEWLSYTHVDVTERLPEKLFEESLHAVPMILEEVIAPHPLLKTHFGNHRFVLRIFTYKKNPDEDAVILYPILRFYTNSALYAAALDAENGKILCPAKNAAGDFIDQFPRSHRNMMGFCMPEWNALRALAAQCAAAYTDLPLLAWDLTFNEKGKWELLSAVYRGNIGLWQASAGCGIVRDLTKQLDWSQRLFSRNLTSENNEFAVYPSEKNTLVDERRFFLPSIPCCEAERTVIHKLRLSGTYRTLLGEGLQEAIHFRPDIADVVSELHNEAEAVGHAEGLSETEISDLYYTTRVLNFSVREYYDYHFENRPISKRISYLSMQSAGRYYCRVFSETLKKAGIADLKALSDKQKKREKGLLKKILRESSWMEYARAQSRASVLLQEVPGLEPNLVRFGRCALRGIEKDSSEEMLLEIVRSSNLFRHVLGNALLHASSEQTMADAAVSEIERFKETTVSVLETYEPLIADMLVMQEVFHFFYWEYFCLGFEQRTITERLEFVSERAMVEDYYHSLLLENLSDARRIADKYRAWKALRPYYRREVMEIWFGGSAQNREEFVAMALKYPKLIVKPKSNCSGRGIRTVECQDREEAEQIYQEIIRIAPAVCEEWIESDAALAEFHPESVNSIRIYTYRSDSGVKVFCPWFKTGCGDAVIDNAAAGGLIAAVDADTGIVISDGGGEQMRFERHPDSGIPFKGFQIPKWEALCDMVKACSSRFPGLPVIGWDVALSADRGWQIVEANSTGGINGVQLSTGEGILRNMTEILEWEDRLYGKRNLRRDENISLPDCPERIQIPEFSEDASETVPDAAERYIFDLFRLTEFYRDAYGKRYLELYNGKKALRKFEAAVSANLLRLPYRMLKTDLLGDLVYMQKVLGFEAEEYFAYEFALKSIGERAEYISEYNLEKNLYPRINGKQSPIRKERLMELFPAWCGEPDECCVRLFTVSRGSDIRMLFPVRLFGTNRDFGAAVDMKDGHIIGNVVDRVGNSMPSAEKVKMRRSGNVLPEWESLKLMVKMSAGQMQENPVICWHLSWKNRTGWSICNAEPSGDMRLYQASAKRGVLREFAEALRWDIPSETGQYIPASGLPEFLDEQACELMEASLIQLKKVTEGSVHLELLKRIRSLKVFQDMRENCSNQRRRSEKEALKPEI